VAASQRLRTYARVSGGEQEKQATVLAGHLWRPSLNRPFGWRYTKPCEGERHGVLEHEPDEVPVMIEMCETIASGRSSAHGVAAMLNSRGLRTVRGNPWTAGAVVRVVTNPLHTGVAPTNRWCTHAPKTRKKEYPKRQKNTARQRPREDWITVEVPPIITPELAAAVQAQLARNRRQTSRINKLPYLLSGLMVCVNDHEENHGQSCGRTLQGYCNSMRPAERRAPELLLVGVGGVDCPSRDERQHGHLRVGYGHGEAARRGRAGSTGGETCGLQVRCDGESRSELGCRAHRYGLGDPHVRGCGDHLGR
jgi:hypothetical protein